MALASLGISGDAAHASTGGYHEGRDDLHRAGRAPEDPGSDYSYTESQRDRAGLTDAASAFDLGGSFPRFRDITLGLVTACELGDGRTRDIREVIYTPDGKTVRRWDRLGRRTSADSSHLWHTHVSFFRDSEGRRADSDNFLGLLRELFEGVAKPPAPPVAVGNGHAPGTRVLRVATPLMTGADVAFVQHYIGPAECGPSDGAYGVRTKAGVAWYQRMRGIPSDGICGPQTFREMGVS